MYSYPCLVCVPVAFGLRSGLAHLEPSTGATGMYSYPCLVCVPVAFGFRSGFAHLKPRKPRDIHHPIHRAPRVGNQLPHALLVT